MAKKRPAQLDSLITPAEAGMVDTEKRDPPERAELLLRQGALDRVMEELECGKTLPEILDAPNMPAYRTLMQWLEDDPEAMARYRRARAIQIQLWIDEGLQLARTPIGPSTVPLPDDFDYLDPQTQQAVLKAALSSEMQRRRILISYYQWLAERVARGVFGKAYEAAKENPDGSSESGGVNVNLTMYAKAMRVEREFAPEEAKAVEAEVLQKSSENDPIEPGSDSEDGGND